ncbi:MAG: hypothetical protein IPH80_34040 [Myxococcales bacterium]|nr:hypothetical protein [Myxococcales bacterium]
MAFDLGRDVAEHRDVEHDDRADPELARRRAQVGRRRWPGQRRGIGGAGGVDPADHDAQHALAIDDRQRVAWAIAQRRRHQQLDPPRASGAGRRR